LSRFYSVAEPPLACGRISTGQSISETLAFSPHAVCEATLRIVNNA